MWIKLSRFSPQSDHQQVLKSVKSSLWMKRKQFQALRKGKSSRHLTRKIKYQPLQKGSSSVRLTPRYKSDSLIAIIALGNAFDLTLIASSKIMLSLRMELLPILYKVLRQEDQLRVVCIRGLFLCPQHDRAPQQAISFLHATPAMADKGELPPLCSRLSKLRTVSDKTLLKTERKSARQWSRFSMKTKSELKVLMASVLMLWNQWEATITIRSVPKFYLCTTNRSRWVSLTSTEQDSNWRPTHASTKPRQHFLLTKSSRSIPLCFKRSPTLQFTTNKPWRQVQVTSLMGQFRTTIWCHSQWIADRMRWLSSRTTSECEETKATNLVS